MYSHRYALSYDGWCNILTVNDWVLTPTAWCFLPRFIKKSSKVCRSSRWLTAASITNITWKMQVFYTISLKQKASSYVLILPSSSIRNASAQQNVVFSCPGQDHSRTRIRNQSTGSVRRGWRNYWPHLGNMFQELWAREALWHDSTLGFVAEQGKQSWVQLKKPRKDTSTVKPH